MKESLTEEYSEERGGDVHISDLVTCPRQRVFKIIDPVPLTDRELNFFSSGRGIHSALESLIMRYPERFEHEKELVYSFEPKDKSLGNRITIEAHVDMYDKMNNIPIEAKTRRVAKVDKAKSFHYKQLHYYQSLLDAENGVILYQLLINFEANPWVEFHSNLSKEQRSKILEQLEIEAESFFKARTLKKPELARHVMNDPDFNTWLCENKDWKTKEVKDRCPYYDQCRAMNQPKRLSGPDAELSPDLTAKYLLD